MAKARVGDVVELDADPVPVIKLIGQCKRGAKLERIAEVFSTIAYVKARSEARREDEAATQVDVVARPKTEVEGTPIGEHK